MSDRPRFAGVLLDWRGTLVVAPTYSWLVQRALHDLRRRCDQEAVQAVLPPLRSTEEHRLQRVIDLVLPGTSL